MKKLALLIIFSFSTILILGCNETEEKIDIEPELITAVEEDIVLSSQEILKRLSDPNTEFTAKDYADAVDRELLDSKILEGLEYCQVEDILGKGDRCLDNTGNIFTVLPDGRAHFLSGFYGGDVVIFANVNGKPMEFSAIKQENGEYKLLSVSP